MIDLTRINTLTDNPAIIGFAKFINAQATAGRYPKISGIDLMTVPRLVKHLAIFDCRDLENRGLVFKYCGTGVDEIWGRNVQGKSFNQEYKGADRQRLLDEGLNKIKDEKFAFYSKRYDRLDDQKHDNIYVESLTFPCSEDGENIDHLIALAMRVHLTDQSLGVFEKIPLHS